MHISSKDFQDRLHAGNVEKNNVRKMPGGK